METSDLAALAGAAAAVGLAVDRFIKVAEDIAPLLRRRRLIDLKVAQAQGEVDLGS